MLKSLGCAGKIGNCSVKDGRFHVTCLWCRWRRKSSGKYKEPSWWIEYTYVSWFHTYTADSYCENGTKFFAKDGGKLKLHTYTTLLIDPRGWFCGARCAVIVLIDRVASRLVKARFRRSPLYGWGYGKVLPKPWAEICEFLANYP